MFTKNFSKINRRIFGKFSLELVQAYNKLFTNLVISCQTKIYKSLVYSHSHQKLRLYEERWAFKSWYGPRFHLAKSVTSKI